MKRILILFLLTGGIFSAAGQIYVPGEELFYRVSYRAKLVPNTEVATVVVRTSEVELDGQTVYNVFGQGQDAGLVPVVLLARRPVQHLGRYRDAAHRAIHERYPRRGLYLPQPVRLRLAGAARGDPLAAAHAARKPEGDGAHRREHGRRVAFFNMRSADAASFRVGEQRVLQMVLEDTIRHLRYRFEDAR